MISKSKIKFIHSLEQKKFRKESKMFVAEGHKLVEDLLPAFECTYLTALTEWLETHKRPFWLRYVLVPGYSDDEKDIRQLGEHFKQYTMIERVEILPYHRLGVHKYEAMGLDYQLKEVKENTQEQLVRAENLFKEYFPTVVVN